MVGMTRTRSQSVLFVGVSAGLASCISLIGGIGIEAITGKLLPLIPLIVALPALNTMVGDYAAIIAAHAGDPTEGKHSMRKLLSAVAKSIWVNIFGVLALSLIIAQQRGYIMSEAFLAKFVLFVVFSFVGIVLSMFAITISLNTMLKKSDLNPDDVLIPVVTSITDVMMLGLIAAATVTIF
jgi:cation transporter-like permease